MAQGDICGPVTGDTYGYFDVGEAKPSQVFAVAGVMERDLQRTFTISAFRTNVDGSTHCTAFVIRMLKALGLRVSGSQIAEHSAKEGLGVVAAASLGLAWEDAWGLV